MTTTADDVPDWVAEVICRLAQLEGISLEQASRLLLYHGATYFSEKIERMENKGGT